MSSDVTHSKDFNRIHDLNLDTVNLAKSSQAKTAQENISKTAHAVIHQLQSPDQEIDQDRIAHFISNVDKINKQFKEEHLGAPFATSLVALNILFNLRQQLPKDQQAVIKHPFVVKLSELSSGGEIEDELKVATELYQFLKTCLNPALLAVQSGRELEALKPIVQQCSSLAQSFSQLDTKGVLAQQRKDMIQTWKLKSFQSKTFYRKMLSYHVGKIPTLGEAKTREQITQELIDTLPEFYGYLELGLISTQEQTALYKGILGLQKDFQQYDDGKKLDPLLKTLREKCKISEPSAPAPQKTPVQKRESSKEKEPEEENVFKKWREKEAQAATAQPKKEKPEKEKTTSSQAPSTQERKAKIIEAIQLKISKLDLGSSRFKENVQEIITDLKRLKSFLGTSSDISSIEAALTLLIDPQDVSISKAEQRFIQLLGQKYKLTARELEGYSQFKGPSIQNALSALIRELKKNAPHFEKLNNACQLAVESLPTQAMKDRLRSFASNNSLKAIITPLFVSNFAYIVSAFNVLSEQIVQQEFESKWVEILAIYDSSTGGRFSKRVVDYSFLDPRRHFEIYKESYQKLFVDSLDFVKMGQMKEDETLSYLTTHVKAFQQHPGQYFSDIYKTIYQEKHLWLLQNIAHIKRAYNQGDQDNTNLGEGVCYNNSLYRWQQIAQNPQISNGDILLGSNNQTRVNQNRDQRFYEEYKKNAITAEEVEKKRKEIASSYGLKPPLTTPIQPSSSKQSLHEALEEAIGQWSKAGHKQVLVVLRKPSGTGHAVNIRFDKKNNIYSLIDDNIGLVQYKSLEELKKQMSTYFKHFYPEFTSYEFETF